MYCTVVALMAEITFADMVRFPRGSAVGPAYVAPHPLHPVVAPLSFQLPGHPVYPLRGVLPKEEVRPLPCRCGGFSTGTGRLHGPGCVASYSDKSVPCLMLSLSCTPGTPASTIRCRDHSGSAGHAGGGPDRICACGVRHPSPGAVEEPVSAVVVSSDGWGAASLGPTSGVGSASTVPSPATPSSPSSGRPASGAVGSTVGGAMPSPGSSRTMGQFLLPSVGAVAAAGSVAPAPALATSGGGGGGLWYPRPPPCPHLRSLRKRRSPPQISRTGRASRLGCHRPCPEAFGV